MDFVGQVLYVQERWRRLSELHGRAEFEEAEQHAHLCLNEAAKAWLFFTFSGLSEKEIADLRLQVGGDLHHWNENRAFRSLIK